MLASRHAQVRSHQRAIPEIMIDLLLQFGSSESAGSGACKMFFDKVSRRRVKTYAGPLADSLALADSLEEHMDLYAVVGHDMKVITVGYRLERIRRH